MKEAHDHHRVSQEGRLLGEQMARLYDIAETRLVDAETEIPQTRITELTERCKTCAFRPGTVPNGCAQTQMDISKCAVEGIPFYCHQHAGQLCRGWVITRAGLHDVLEGMAVITKEVKLSPPDSQAHIVNAAEAKRERRAERNRRLAAKVAQNATARPVNLVVSSAPLIEGEGE
jgi:hypothetical protein